MSRISAARSVFLAPTGQVTVFNNTCTAAHLVTVWLGGGLHVTEDKPLANFRGGAKHFSQHQAQTTAEH